MGVFQIAIMIEEILEVKPSLALRLQGMLSLKSSPIIQIKAQGLCERQNHRKGMYLTDFMAALTVWRMKFRTPLSICSTDRSWREESCIRGVDNQF